MQGDKMIDKKELRAWVTRAAGYYHEISLTPETVIELLDELELKTCSYNTVKSFNAVLKEERAKLLDVLKAGRPLVTQNFMLHMRSDRQIRFDAAVEACADIQIEGVE